MPRGHNVGCILGSFVTTLVVMQCLARLRLGGHDLQTRLGRTTSQVPWHQRVCRLCSKEGAPFFRQHDEAEHVEDVRHFLLECPAYQHVRDRDSVVFGSALAPQTSLYDIFDCEHQDQLAHAVYTMTKFREHCLLCAQGAAVTVESIQRAVEAHVELIRIN